MPKSLVRVQPDQPVPIRPTAGLQFLALAIVVRIHGGERVRYRYESCLSIVSY